MACSDRLEWRPILLGKATLGNSIAATHMPRAAQRLAYQLLKGLLSSTGLPWQGKDNLESLYVFASVYLSTYVVSLHLVSKYLYIPLPCPEGQSCEVGMWGIMGCQPEWTLSNRPVNSSPMVKYWSWTSYLKMLFQASFTFLTQLPVPDTLCKTSLRLKTEMICQQALTYKIVL